MKKMIALLLMLLIALSAGSACAANEDWYEMSASDYVLTVRLDCDLASGDKWSYQISNADALQLLTMETLGDEWGEDAKNGLWVASFMSAYERPGYVTLTLRRNRWSATTPEETREIYMYVGSDHKIQLFSASALQEAQQEATTYVETTGNVYVRTGAGLEYRSVISVAKGRKLEYAGENARDSRGMVWYKVLRSNGQPGWVSARYAKLLNVAQCVKATGDTNIRGAASLDGKVLDTMQKGETREYMNQCKLDDRQVTWYAVRLDNGKTGWVSSRYGELLNVKQYVEAADGDTNIRSKPGLDGKVIGLMRKGDSREYMNQSRLDDRLVTWYAVRMDDGRTGWVSSKWTKLR